MDPLLATISFLIATRMFSMVVVSFQFLRRARFSTLPVPWLMQGRLHLLLNLKMGAVWGYDGPHSM